ncbi:MULTISPECIES: PriCT-2 domain-containing protein, partial [Streptomyces]
LPALQGTRPAIFDGHNLPDLTAAARANMPNRAWYDDLPEADQKEVVYRCVHAIPNGGHPDWDRLKHFAMCIYAAAEAWSDRNTAGLDALMVWSRKHSCHADATTQQVWREVMRSPPTALTVGTLISDGREHGADFSDLRKDAAAAN